MTGFALIALPMMASCALFPLGEADCKPASWRDRGYADGFGGDEYERLRTMRDR